jgi:hypothetical protein
MVNQVDIQGEYKDKAEFREEDGEVQKHVVALQPGSIFTSQWQHLVDECRELRRAFAKEVVENRKLRALILSYRKACSRCSAVSGPCETCKEVIGIIKEAADSGYQEVKDEQLPKGLPG